jgi:hypothetical protein
MGEHTRLGRNIDSSRQQKVSNHKQLKCVCIDQHVWPEGSLKFCSPIIRIPTNTKQDAALVAFCSPKLSVSSRQAQIIAKNAVSFGLISNNNSTTLVGGRDRRVGGGEESWIRPCSAVFQSSTNYQALSFEVPP